MATADFPASYVYDAAVERAVKLNEDRKAAREKCLAEIMGEKVIEGRWWWRKEYFRTREQAVNEYERNRSYVGSHRYWTELSFNNAINCVAPLQRLAAAVMNSGTGTISLAPEDCAALDIPFGFKVAA